jgi:hypothetical protein
MRLALSAADHYLLTRTVHDGALAKRVLRLARMAVRASHRSKRRGLAYSQEQAAQWKQARNGGQEPDGEPQ